MSYRRFPPWKGHIFVPVSSTSEALAGLSLYTPSRRRGLILKSAAEGLVRAFGPRCLPGRSTRIAPVPIAEWAAVESLLQRELGPFDAVAVHTRRLPHRPGAALLILSRGCPVAFAKIGSEPGIENEYLVLSLMDRSGPPATFQAPFPRGVFSVGETRVATMTVLPHHHHRPMAHPPLASIVQDIQRALRRLPRPEGIPPQWVPMHGDLSPWNLRVDSTHHVVLFDWEEAGFGPRGADEVYYAVTSAAVGHPYPTPTRPALETLSFWRSRLEARPPSRLRTRMLRELAKLQEI